MVARRQGAPLPTRNQKYRKQPHAKIDSAAGMAGLSDPVTNILTRRANHLYIYILTVISILEHRRPGLRAGGPYAVSSRCGTKADTSRTMSAGDHGSRFGGRDDGGEYLSPSSVVLADLPLRLKPVGWVEPFAKPIALILADLMGIALSSALRAKEKASPILRAPPILRPPATKHRRLGLRAGAHAPCLATSAVL